MSRKQGMIYIGTSGWMYKDWGKTFYPEDLKKGHLSYLASEFDTVEVNSSFYHLPLKSTFETWTSETPENFVFAVKLSRYITHRKKLKGVRGPLERFVKHAAPMRKKLGVVLVQLPPSLAYNAKLLEKFLEDVRVVSGRNYPIRFALEPRHRSWMDHSNIERIRTLMQDAHISLVFAHSATTASYAPGEENVTSDLIYVRFHGPSEFGASRYGFERLRPWADRICEWRGAGKTVFAFFNNDAHGHAIYDARTLKRQVACDERGQ